MKFLIPFLFVLRLYASDCLCTIAGTTKIADNGSFAAAGDGYVTIAGGVTTVSQAAGQSYLHSTAGNTLKSAAQCIFDIPAGIGLVISNRWMASTNTIGAYGTSVTNWIDETNHFYWTQSTTANQPTNSSSGVCFVSGKYLAGTNVFLNSALVVFAIVNAIRDSSVSDNGILISSDGNHNWLGLLTFGDLPHTFHWDGVNFDYGAQSINTAQNLIVGGDAAHWYTNGQLAPVISGTLYPFPFAGDSHIGSQYNAASPFDGYLQELIIFTNTTITATQVSNLNYYANHLYW